MADEDDQRIILAWKEPPAEYGFTRSKSGKSYWLKVPTTERAQAIAADLAALDIHGKITRLKPLKLPYFPRRNGLQSSRTGYGGRRNYRSARHFYR